jgi:manganese/zinc/iron transport system ATP- binding protein
VYALKDLPAITPVAPITALPRPLLEVEQLSVYYREGEPALCEMSFAVEPGESLAIIGPNGAGKSTLLKTIMGLLPVAAGSIRLANTNIGYVPQHESIDWDFPITVREVVLMGRTRQIGWLRRASKLEWQAADTALGRVGMADFARRQIGELSGGQRRRVFIARALAQEARLLLLDEPFSGVDAGAQDGLMQVLDRLHADGLTILLTTHDLSLAFQRFDRVLALNRKLIACGLPSEVYRPGVLSQLYGGRLATWQDHGQMHVFVDDHCADCG